LEEAYEVVSAIDAQDDENLAEELGDLLLQVVFHAQIAQEEGRFHFDEVARGISEKLVRRHPHVFGAENAADSEAVHVVAPYVGVDAAGKQLDGCSGTRVVGAEVVGAEVAAA
jgi:uncharacterized protein YabN with tetrapyrrole methylase and pyrophosphatase domain